MDKYIELKGTKVHYTEQGEGRPIILLHGWGCDTTTLASVERVAVDTHKVYNIDFPGFGKSEEPPEVWDVYDYADMLAEFIEKLGIERPSMLGHSFGGRVGIIHASRHDVDKLILVDAAGVKPRRSLSYYLKVYQFKAMKRLALLTMGKKKGGEFIERQRAKRGSSDYRGASPRMRAIMSKVVNEDLCHLMPAIKAPTLLIWGENDTATPIGDARKMEKLIPGSGLVSFAGCGHYSFLDNPVQFAAVLRSFLKS